ncbi:MAG: tyrosine-type recombinase/integrase [Bacteroidota bacterium]
MKVALELSSKPNRDGLFEIYIRIQEGGKKKRVRAKIAVKPNQFKSKNHNLKWVYNHPNHQKINADLNALIEEYNDVMFASAVSKKVLSPETVIHSVKKTHFTQSLVKYCESKMSQMLNYNHKKGYQQTLNNWKDYIEKEKLGDLDFKQINVFILKGYENYLFENGLQASTVYTNLKRIRSLFNMAIKEQVIKVEDYIFKAYTMPKANKSKKEKLTVEELKKFAGVACEKGSLIKTCQQAFLLSFNLAGVRIEDVLTLKWSYVKKERIEYRMGKTGALNSVKITPQIKAILKYYKSINQESQYIVPILKDDVVKMSNEDFKKEISRKTALVNKYLKIIATKAKIDKKITTHIARHTFASIAIRKTNGNINFVQNALKHSNSKITQAYLESLDDESMDDQMGKVTKL